MSQKCVYGDVYMLFFGTSLCLIRLSRYYCSAFLLSPDTSTSSLLVSLLLMLFRGTVVACHMIIIFSPDMSTSSLPVSLLLLFFRDLYQPIIIY